MSDRSADFIFRAAGEPGALARALLGALRREIEAARRAAARRRSARELWQMEPHLLRDIGLTRDDLRQAMRDRA